MDIESAYSQSLVPRLTQHLVRRHLIQSVQACADQCTNYAADEPSDCGGYHYSLLRWLVTVLRGDPGASTGAGAGAGARSCPRAGSGTRVMRRFVGVVSVWHVSPTPVFAKMRYVHTRKQHPAARVAGVCGATAPGRML